MEIAIISEELLKANSPITNDTVITEFVPYVSIAQSIYIEPVLGAPLMDELKLQIEENSLTPLNSKLILKIAPSLAYFTSYQALPFHWAKIVNKGITIKESENSKGVALNDISQLRRWLRNDAELLLKLLVRYLHKHKDEYPLWRPDKKCGSISGADDGSFETGIYLKR